MNLPRATDLIAEAGLSTWSPWLQPKHLRRGRVLNQATDLVIMGQDGNLEAWFRQASGDPKNPDDFVEHEEVRHNVAQFRRWLDDSGAKLVMLGATPMKQFEVRETSLGYVGHPDYLIKFPNGRICDVELKRGEPAEWHPLQTALYYLGILCDLKLRVDRANLYLPADGSYHYEPHIDRRDIDDARTLAQFWHMKKRRMG